MSDNQSNRRQFLKQAGKSGSIPLIGTALAATPFQPRTTPKTAGGKSIIIPTHEHAGERDERLDFPPGWDIHVQNMAGHNLPVLTPKQLADQMNQPVGARTLRELAQGK